MCYYTKEQLHVSAIKVGHLQVVHENLSIGHTNVSGGFTGCEGGGGEVRDLVCVRERGHGLWLFSVYTRSNTYVYLQLRLGMGYILICTRYIGHYIVYGLIYNIRILWYTPFLHVRVLLYIDCLFYLKC